MLQFIREPRMWLLLTSPFITTIFAFLLVDIDVGAIGPDAK
jgi:hypothetical protein